jgi:prepilin-type N-terminal cleavage/methylation domain-containing protein
MMKVTIPNDLRNRILRRCSSGRERSGFTMVEIALCLAIIGFALVAIVGVLPYAMDVQKFNRLDTIVLQDSTIFTDAIRGGARSMDDIANYVVAITNYPTFIFGGKMAPQPPIGYVGPMTGREIIGLLSTPKFVPGAGPGRFTSNYVVAIVRSISGPANEKFPQKNQIVQDLGLTYKLISEVVPCSFGNGSWTNTSALHELRLTFRYPYVIGRGTLGPGRQVFRTTIGGLLRTNEAPFYFFQPRTYSAL